MPAPLGNVTHCTIHCAATPRGRDVHPRLINQWDISKFGQRSYHYIITLDGVIHENLSLDHKGAHVGGHNTGNIGICYVGGTERNGSPADTRTDAQKAALHRLTAALKTRFPSIIFLGHRDWPNVAKACPCFDVKAENYG